jgi:hypothetical protein
MLTGSVSFEPADTSNPIFRRYTGCMALSVRVSGLDAYGVELFSPTRPEFDEFARPLLGERIANVGLRLKPMLAIVSNENVRTIVSLSLSWHVIHRDGTTGRYWSHTSFPDVICGDVSHDPAGLKTGQRRIEAYGLVIHGWSQWDEYFDQFLGQFVEQKDALLADAVDLHIELNAVIFADGTLIGADDESALRDLFSAYVQAKQDWYRGIIEALDAGQSVADSFAPVERFLADSTNRLRAGHFMGEKPGDLWTRQAAAEAKSWHRRHADENIRPLLKQAIRLDPFIIRRD